MAELTKVVDSSSDVAKALIAELGAEALVLFDQQTVRALLERDQIQLS